MPKKLSEIQKKEIVESFINGKTIDELSEDYNYTKMTITRHLKKSISEKEYKDLLKKKSLNNALEASIEKRTGYKSEIKKFSFKENDISDNRLVDTEFVEITPLDFIDYEIENSIQKDLSSISISEIEFPKTLYMIVNRETELEIKLLKDYPDWQFLAKEELDRKTIEIFMDLKIAKRFCKKDQKVIKIPNTNVFKIVAPLLMARGISRIVGADRLIAL